MSKLIIDRNDTIGRKRKVGRILKNIICILAILYLIIHPFLVHKNDLGSLHFREYAFPILLLISIVYGIFKRNIIKVKTNIKDVDVYVATKDNKKINIIGEDRNIIVTKFVDKGKSLSIDRNFKEITNTLFICDSKKIIKIICGLNDSGELDIKVNNKYFSVEGLSDEEKCEILNVISKYK